MKTYFMALAICAGVFLHGCGGSLLDSRYTVELPQLPQGWETLLGSPYWQLEWVNSDGQPKTMTVRNGQKPTISLPQTWASPVSALPFWPDSDLGPGIFRPAGAIFPYNAADKRLTLSWQGGVDANLFWELAKAYDGLGQETISPEEDPLETQSFLSARAAVPRLPWNFDWLRFRRLFDDPTVNADVRADPWLADWPGIAAKIVQSGFDKRRLVPEPRGNLSIPVGRGPWIGSSPFAAPLLFETEPVFPVRLTADTWVSCEGILRCNTQTWILVEK